MKKSARKLLDFAVVAVMVPGLVSVAEGKGHSDAVVGTTTQAAVSLPASSLPPATDWVGPVDPTRVRKIENDRLPKAPKEKRGRGDLDQAVQSFSLGAPMAIPLQKFEGVSNADNATAFGFRVVPPDTNGDVGPNHYVQVVNLLFQVYDKQTGLPLLAGPTKISSLFTGFGGACETTDDGDPVVLYDPLADRWLLTQFSASGPPFHECVAVSQSGDPTGSYFLYDFVMPGTKFNDYPKFGVWPDAYYMSDNQFDGVDDSWRGAGVFAFDRTKMLSGDATASYIYFDLEPVDSSIGGLLPADLDGPPPPAGTPNYFSYFVANEFGDSSDGLRLFEFHADFANPSNSTFTERAESPLATAAFDPVLNCGSSGSDCIAQPAPAGNNAKLDALSDRLMYRLQYRNFGTYESLVTNHTVDADGSSHAGVRYYQLRRNLSGGAFAIAEQATYAPDTKHRWMGSAAMDRLGNLAVGYSLASSTVFPSIYYAGRLASDPPGGLFQTETLLQAGSGSQTTSYSRWGDYSMLAVDPVDDCTFWYTTEYFGASDSLGWRTKIGSFRFPGCGNSPTPTGSPTPSASPLVGTVTPSPSPSPTTASVPSPITLVASADSWIQQDKVDQNKGVDSKLQVKPASGKVRRTLLRFDLSQIPASACLASAELQLRLVTVQSSSRTFAVHRLLSDWTEGTGGNNSGVTWNRSNGSTTWTAGGNFAAGASATAATGTSTGAVVKWNVTTDVAAMRSGAQLNRGWLVKDSNEKSGNEFAFASRENGTAANRPKLQLTFAACP